MTIAYIITDSGRISAVVKGRSYVVEKDHPNYKDIKKAVNEKNVDVFLSLFSVEKAIVDFTDGQISVRNGVLFYAGKPVHNSLADRILDTMRQGFEASGLLRFLDNLMQNPSKRAVEELYPFLTRKAHYEALPVTEDGCFLAYKSVRDDYNDWHSNTVSFKPSTTVSMQRNEVDDNFGLACSQGYHVGSLSYVAEFHPEGRIIIVKVNPRDVVSVPSDENCTKCRVCSLYVVCDYEGELKKPVYRVDNSNIHLGGRSDNDPIDEDEDDGWSFDDRDEDDDEYLEDLEEESALNAVDEYVSEQGVSVQESIHKSEGRLSLKPESSDKTDPIQDSSLL